jgi:spermidine synthase
MNFLAKWRLRKPADDAETAYVSEKFGVRSLHIGSDTVQSAMRLAKPLDLELAYTRSMMAFLLFNDDPRDVFMIGLGGGSLAKFIYHRLPAAVTRVVEKSDQVVAIARQMFQLPADDERLEVVVGDGADWVTRDEVWADVLIVDGYDAESQAEALSTKAFYEDCRKRLEPQGILVINLWGGDREFNQTLRRIEAAFPAGTLCLPAEKPGNVIVFGFRSPPDGVRWGGLAERAVALQARHGLEFPRFVESLRKMNRHDAESLLF